MLSSRVVEFQGTLEETCSEILTFDSIGRKLGAAVDYEDIKKILKSSTRHVRRCTVRE